jgi:hypothetical protein
MAATRPRIEPLAPEETDEPHEPVCGQRSCWWLKAGIDAAARDDVAVARADDASAVPAHTWVLRRPRSPDRKRSRRWRQWLEPT